MGRRGYRPAPNRHTVKLRAKLAQRNADLAVETHLTRARQRAAIAALMTPAGDQAETPENEAPKQE